MILVTGSLAFDFIMNFPGKFADHLLPEKLHVINLSFLVNNLRQERGGCAANIAYSLALLGEKAAIVGCLGGDGAGYKDWLKKQKVNVEGIKIGKRVLTSSAFVMTDSADNQITGFYSGAMAANSRLGLYASYKKYFDDKEIKMVVIAPNEPKAMVVMAKECHKLGVPYLFDPGMQIPCLSNKELLAGLSGAKIVIGNDYEIALIKSRCKKWLNFKNDRQIWITTLGEKGSLILHKGKTIKVKPAWPKKVLDPTGAGDAFRAGFLHGFLKTGNLRMAGQMGSVAAVYTVEKYGTTTHRFSKEEFARRYKENYGRAPEGL